MKLQKLMAGAGVASRRASEKLIAAGRVKVNGRVVTAPGTRVVPGQDRVEVDGRPLRGQETKVYYIFNKPAGCVTTMRDPAGRKTVADLLPDLPARVFTAGRLDYASRGLLLLTNDGELANKLIHPAEAVSKTYLVRVQGRVAAKDLQDLRKGITLADGLTRPCDILVEEDGDRSSLLRITLTEGRNRQIRRMLAAVGNPVIDLKRIAIGPVGLGDLPEGEVRQLTPVEVEKLRRLSEAPR